MTKGVPFKRKQGSREKIQGRQTDGGGRGYFSTLLQGAKITDLVGPMGGDLLDTPLSVV